MLQKEEKRKKKLFALLNIMRKKTDENHPIKVKDMIDELDKEGISAERKSIHRDIESLRELGYDIIASGDNAYAYYLGEREFQLAEIKMLIDIVQASRFITKKKSADLISKFKNMVSEYECEQLDRTIILDERVKNIDNENIFRIIDTIQRCMRENTEISFQYFDWSIYKKRVGRHNNKYYSISPWALLWCRETYYMLGYDEESDKIKTYRVDRMDKCEQKKSPRKGEEQAKKINTASFTTKFFDMYCGELDEVILECDADRANSVVDKFGKIPFDIAEDKNSFRIKINVAITPVFLSWVFNYGGAIRIVSPEKAKQKMKEMCEVWMRD